MVTFVVAKQNQTQPWAKVHIFSDSRRNGTEEWVKRPRIIDSTTITPFSNVIFKDIGRSFFSGGIIYLWRLHD